MHRIGRALPTAVATQPVRTLCKAARPAASGGVTHITQDPDIVCSCCGGVGHSAHACTAITTDAGVTRVCSSLDWECGRDPEDYRPHFYHIRETPKFFLLYSHGPTMQKP